MKDPFSTFKKYAFRLELLQKYTVEEEKDSLEHFLETGKVKNDQRDDWVKIIRSSSKRGAIMERVHVIKRPLSKYIRFELEAYKLNVQIGEKVFLLLQEEFDKINTSIKSDFWLFDDQLVLKMDYDNEGRFVSSTEIHNNLKEFIDLKKKLLKIAQPL